MEKKLFEDFGCVIIEKNGKYFIRYDTGESCGSHLVENEITLEETEKAKLSEHDAYQIILKAQQRDKTNT